MESVFIFYLLTLRYLLDNLVDMSNYTLPEVRCELGAGEDNFGESREYRLTG